MNDHTRAELRRRLQAAQPPPLEVARSFVSYHLSDACSLEEARESIEATALLWHRQMTRDLQSIETLIANPPQEEGILGSLIAFDANWVLDDPSDAGALAFLVQLAKMLRETLGVGTSPRA
ncbi:MAG: hypothetical protein KC620_08180 [Myxococcales bacterium]|nr:hypothetical protein [Myxococcales bacterium]